MIFIDSLITHFLKTLHLFCRFLKSAVKSQLAVKSVLILGREREAERVHRRTEEGNQGEIDIANGTEVKTYRGRISSFYWPWRNWSVLPNCCANFHWLSVIICLNCPCHWTEDRRLTTNNVGMDLMLICKFMLYSWDYCVIDMYYLYAF